MMDYGLRFPVKPMMARLKASPPMGEGWVYEPKWDGFRMIAFGGKPLGMASRNGKDLLRYFPELRPGLERLPPGTVVDGEIVLVVDDVTQFDLLQMRIHPAESRIKRLAEELPARLVAFDLLVDSGEVLLDQPYQSRRERLEGAVGGLGTPWHLTPVTRDFEQATAWFHDFEAAGCDGIISKQDSGVYALGKRVWVKWKHRRQVNCVIGGFRIHKEGDRVGSLLLGVYNPEGELHFLGHTSGFSDQERIDLLEALNGIRSDRSFGGDKTRSPGSENRWTGKRSTDWVPVQPVLVAEISYDQLEGWRFRHAARLERWLPDHNPKDCTADQLERPKGMRFSQIFA
ncbi:MAG: ATP-dependent DNA ligase [Acidimicrobiia bacterium]|nr:ATP-dependent DNA ligase [Acidimicrobiia bacterium]